MRKMVEVSAVEKFEKALRGHDWYFAYSDDYGVWRRGEKQLQGLRDLHERVGCPYDLSELRNWVSDNTVDLFVEKSPGEWYRETMLHFGSVAPTQRRDLLSRERHDEISAWFNSLRCDDA